MCKLQEIINKTKCGVSITINEHKNNYQTLEEYIRDLNVTDDDNNFYDLSKELYDEIIENGNFVEIIVYKDTPVGYYNVAHYDLETALDLMLKSI